MTASEGNQGRKGGREKGGEEEGGGKIANSD